MSSSNDIPSGEAPRIAVDAMGGDFGPHVIVPGAVEAAREHNIRVTLAGDGAAIERELAKLDVAGLPIEVEHASEVVTMEDKPSDVVRRKKDSSIHVACRLVREGRADGVISAGNSGATMACGIFILGRIKGIERPALAGIVPSEKDPVVLIDVGANVDAKSSHLFQFGLMADIFAQQVLGYTVPRVGLLSIGEEQGKGNSVVNEAYKIFQQSNLYFVGNVEGRDIFTGKVDVVVCDGFVGNVAIKLSEGMAKTFGHLLKNELKRGVFSKLGSLFSVGAFDRFKRLLDYAEYGGAPLLGLNSIAIVCHGASNSKAIRSAVTMAAGFVESKANEYLIQGLQDHERALARGSARSAAS